MTTKRIACRQLFTGVKRLYDHVLTITDDVIVDIDNNIEHADVRLTGLVSPGFIDLQVNGGGGILLNNSPTVAGIKTIVAAHQKFGTTAMLPTLITDDIEVMKQAASAVSVLIKENDSGILGIHFEGPHLSVAKKGAHSEAFIRGISEAEWQILSRKDLGQIFVTIAPENVSIKEIERMVNLGIKVSLGHSNADHETVTAALAHGADSFTHLFNAMSPLQGRHPGMVGAALLNDNAYCGLIVDGHHVAEASCQLALKAKPKGKIYLVTDAMAPVGTEQTVFKFFDRTVELNNGKLTSTTGELAGSVLDMATAVRNTHQNLKVTIEEAIRMATSYPATYFGLSSQMGNLAIGCKANLVELDQHFQVMSTWLNGRCVFQKT